MKRFSIALIFLIFCGFSLHAQSDHTVSIYIEATSGYGPIPENNAWYKDLLAHEVESRKHRLSEFPAAADYSLKVFIGGPYTESAIPAPFTGYYEPHHTAGNIYLFHLVLESNKEHLYVAEQNLLFDTVDTLKEFLPVLIDHVFALIPDGSYVPPPPVVAAVPPPSPPLEPTSVETEHSEAHHYIESPSWRTKWLYLGAHGLVSYTRYQNNEPQPFTVTLGGGVVLELNFLDFLSLETGIDIVPSGLTKTGNFLDDQVMEIPAALKFLVDPPSEKFVFGAFGGIRANIPIKVLIQPDQMLEPSFLSWFAGFHYETKIGPGVLFVTPYFSKDLYKFKLHWDQYEATMSLRLGIGYKMGFFTKI